MGILETFFVINCKDAKEISFNLSIYDKDNNETKVDKTLYEIWREEVDSHRQRDGFIVLSEGAKTTPGTPWLYAEETDYFVECSIPEYDENTVWFVRSVGGGWFSIDVQSLWMSGRLMPVEFNAEEYFKNLY